ncbi:carbamate kinase [Caldisphaera lagunensis DSM 15908]|uniref:Carbamate kinase n=1 Tax=Caldisphaera lagunensis (strain DSM 15908 / JCM 11604 / ANMR 0165 / IC-154) TaxID=1056495 RepID=L0AAZ2_CALLD|nr:carbamate kinase [Caldisphaera lagunensis]AFZ71046.1 carbamate kinase [Caldisphaera lagunensis DSM 15908]
MRLLIALGGNAILKKGDKGTVDEQWRNIKDAAEIISSIIKENDELILTHGNGPQVGYLLEVMQASNPEKALTIDIADAMTEGWIGYMLQNAFSLYLPDRKAVPVLTRTLVLENDEAFSHPTKFVGSYFTKDQAEILSKKYGWVFKEDPRGGFRRVVPSPMPVDIIEIDVIEKLIKDKYIVISVGGGGIPVIKKGNNYVPVEAVIDKDLASSLLATKIKADKFIILTDVKGVAINYGKKDEKWLDKISVDELKDLYKKNEFPEGSMGPKILAAIKFVESTGNKAIIGSLDNAREVYEEKSGTMIYKD